MYSESKSNAVAKQTEMEALEPSPEPIGIVDFKWKETFRLDEGLARDVKR